MTLPQASRGVLPPRDVDSNESSALRALESHRHLGVPCKFESRKGITDQPVESEAVAAAWPLKLTVALGRLQLPGEMPAQIVVR
jgi:hypothetical protein